MSKVPHTIGIIMDGNRRWAKERGLPTLIGHKIGIEKIEEALGWAREAGTREVIFYVFSTENWNRSAQEVEYLLELFEEMLGDAAERILAQDARLLFVGQRERFSPKLQERMRELEERSRESRGGTVALALSYGGRPEIVHAANALVREGAQEITEENLRARLWSAELSDPDIILRAGGEQRLSNFLLWGSAYSELFFVDTYWPAFTREEFDRVLAEYAERDRRHGR